MAVKFLEAQRDGFYFVNVFLEKDGAEFKAQWSCIHEGDGSYIDFYLHEITKNKGAEGASLSEDEVYNIWSSSDCEMAVNDRNSLNLDQFNFDLTDTQIWLSEIPHQEDFEFTLNFAINNEFMIQFNGSDFSIPHASEVCWNNDVIQNIAHYSIDSDELVKKLGLDEVEDMSIKEIKEKLSPDPYGDSKLVEAFKKL